MRDRLYGLILAALAFGCSHEELKLDRFEFVCEDASDCPPGHRCTAEEGCVEKGSVPPEPLCPAEWEQCTAVCGTQCADGGSPFGTCLSHCDGGLVDVVGFADCMSAIQCDVPGPPGGAKWDWSGIDECATQNPLHEAAPCGGGEGGEGEGEEGEGEAGEGEEGEGEEGEGEEGEGEEGEGEEGEGEEGEGETGEGETGEGEAGEGEGEGEEGEGEEGEAEDLGCADGTREGFSGRPDIAGCSGAWSVPGIVRPMQPTCGRGGGNDGNHIDGVGCSAADLCAEGWHVCRSALEVQEKGGDCDGALDPNPAAEHLFFATAQRLNHAGACAISGADDVLGCGNIGAQEASCAPLSRRLGTSESVPPWNLGISAEYEALYVTKTGPNKGGVLCCVDDPPPPRCVNFAFDVPVALTSGTRPISVVMADLDGDGLQDLAATNGRPHPLPNSYPEQTIDIHYGWLDQEHDQIWFEGPGSRNAGFHPDHIVAGDLDGDGGPLDLVATNFFNDTVTVFEASLPNREYHRMTNGDSAEASIATADGPKQVALGDLDGDGDLDMVVGNDQAGRVDVFERFDAENLDDRFSPAQQGPAVGSGEPGCGSTGAIVLADVNDDGHLDLMSVDDACDELTVYTGLPELNAWQLDETGSRVGPFGNGGFSAPKGITVADMDGDGAQDIVVTGFSSETVRIIYGRGAEVAGGFESADNDVVVRLDNPSGPSSVLVGDLDRDGNMDLIVRYDLGMVTSLVRIMGAGGRAFGAPQPILGNQRQIGRPALGDYDLDGWLDLAVPVLSPPPAGGTTDLFILRGVCPD